jgi:hypothetical protein
MLKKYRFSILCLVVLLGVLAGAVYRHTALAALRTELTYQYNLTYTVEVPQVPALYTDMYFEGMGLYLDAETPAGTVTAVEAQPAKEAGAYDLTLAVSASGARLTSTGYGDYAITEGNKVDFISRFISFTGYITSVSEE